ncbi:hypothetical protein [uncultured Anaerovibrio sp.]|uniref:hypothetical protein n=1 Tax=uncultured Anaerovibrio sp. TaxID=361586 RepID=UPI00262E4E4F|nr:hypothetical protein [uncultured Anaerovibrio sp.]
MREVISTNVLRMLRILGVLTAIMAVYLLVYGQIILLCGVAAGYIMGIAWYGIMLGRLWRSADMTAAQAKSTMAMGLILRLLLLGAVFAVAIHMGMDQFVAVVTGFAIVYLLGMVLLIQTNYSRYL